MTFEELVKALELEGDDNKDKVATLKKEFNAKTKEINDITEENKKLKEDSETSSKIVEKYNIVVKSFGLDESAEDFDKMLDEVKDKIIKDSGGGVDPNETLEENKTLKRDLAKANRELESKIKELAGVNEELTAEKNRRIDTFKRDALGKALRSNNIIKPDQMIDMFFSKVIVENDGTTLTMKGSDGNDYSLNDAIADWAKENPEFVQRDVPGGAGSAGGGSNSNSGNSGGISDFMKDVVANSISQPGDKTLGELFG